jgi:hypothetical protein
MTEEVVTPGELHPHLLSRSQLRCVSPKEFAKLFRRPHAQEAPRVSR